MNTNPQNLRELHSVKQFVITVERCCDLLEDHAKFAPYEFLRQVAVALTRLYGAAIELPEVDCTFEDDSSAYTQDSREKIDGIGDMLGEFDRYWLVFNPYNEKDHLELPIWCTVSEDLAEIYDDLLRWLTEYRKGIDGRVCEAVWLWRYGHESHWGYHAVHALGAIHWLITNDLVGFRPRAEYTIDDEEE